MMSRIKFAPGYSNLLIKDFTEIYDDVRMSNSIFAGVKEDVATTGAALDRVHRELKKLRRAVRRLCKARPFWFNEDGWGGVDRGLSELNARTRSFAAYVVRPVSLFDIEWYMTITGAADELVKLTRRVRRRVEGQARILVSESRKR